MAGEDLRRVHSANCILISLTDTATDVWNFVFTLCMKMMEQLGN